MPSDRESPPYIQRLPCGPDTREWPILWRNLWAWFWRETVDMNACLCGLGCDIHEVCRLKHFFTPWMLYRTTVSCVSSSVSQTRLLESRGTEQSEPAQLSEHTHTPRDWHKWNMLFSNLWICYLISTFSTFLSFVLISWPNGKMWYWLSNMNINKIRYILQLS